MSSSGPFLADTNVYVTAINDSRFADRFADFLLREGPLLVSSIVVAEVLIGIADPTLHPAAVRAITAGADPLAPVDEDWITAATAVSRLGGTAVTKTRSFWNDALIAAQCGRLGIVLVTNNLADFRRLRRVVAFDMVGPFPG